MQKFDVRIVVPIVLALWLSFGGPGFAQEDAGLTALGDPLESYLEAAQISGSIIVGVQTYSKAASQRPSLSVAVPQGWDKLCLKLSSVDGRYTAEQQFSVAPSWPGGWETIAFKTEYRDALLGYAEREMAVLVRQGDCLAGRGALALSGWNQVPGSDGRLIIMVNSFRADEVYVIDRDTQRDFDCTPVEGTSRTAFDAICPIPLDAFSGSSPLNLEINRVRNGNFDPPEIVEIARAPE